MCDEVSAKFHCKVIFADTCLHEHTWWRRLVLLAASILHVYMSSKDRWQGHDSWRPADQRGPLDAARSGLAAGRSTMVTTSTLQTDGQRIATVGTIQWLLVAKLSCRGGISANRRCGRGRR